MAILDEYIKELETTKSTVLSGENAFKLYDTYGFPVELTEEILAEKKYTIHMENFKINMQTQKETARAGRKASDEAGWASAQYDFSVFGNTEFLGYDTLNTTSRILGLFNQSDEVQSLQQGDKGTIVLDKTPFYPEMGGQVSDNGIMSTNTANLEVVDIEKLQGAYIHRVLVRSGEIKKGDTVDCAVTPSDRNNTCRNHTATHLLHQALKDVLGSHVHQAGSLVSEESLRFDFTHFEGISPEDLLKIETIVNNKINEFIPVVSEELSIDEAKKRGATALFGEKYGDTVRVVTVPNFSMELCGGTHVSNIGQIGAFKILSENGVAAGVRRIEAITGKAMYDHLNTANALLQDAADKLKTNRASLADKLHSILEDHKVTKKELEDFRKQAMGDMVGTLMDSAKEINGVKVLALKFEDFDINELRDMSDTLKSNNASLVMVFASVANEKVTFMVSVSDDLVGKGFHAGNMIKQIAATCGGGGGGKADMAQAGAKDATKVDEALALAEKLVAEVK